MYMDSIDRQERDDAVLARMNPDAYDAMMKARAERGKLFEGIVRFFTRLFSKKK